MTVTIDRLATVGTVWPFGDAAGNSTYFAQTFVAAGATMRSLEFLVDTYEGPDATDYRVLITTVITDANGFHPGTVLKEIKLSDPFDASDALELVHLDLGALGLTPGQTYAIVFDGIADADGVAAKARFGASNLGGGPDFSDGIFANIIGTTGTRPGDFSADWTERPWDIAFKAVFSDPGVTIIGTKKNDKVDGTKSPKNQPKATNDDDVISGKKGNDKIDGLGGFDRIDGGPGKDKLFGGADDDLLIGGKGNDKLTGGPGADSFLFNVSLKEKPDTLGDFTPADDTVLLSNSIFKALALGALPITQFAKGTAADLDDRIIYKPTGDLLYDQDGAGGKKAVVFAKIPAAPNDLGQLDFVVVA